MGIERLKPGEKIERDEYERRFLPLTLPQEILDQLATAEKTKILQGYFSDNTRLRKQEFPDGSIDYIKTLKTTIEGSEGKGRKEEEEGLSQEQFENLWPQAEGAQISKTRYIVFFEGQRLELNVFHGEKLEGRVLVEKEFDDLEGARAYMPPEWLAVREVTKTVSNKRIARGEIPENWPPIFPTVI